MCISILSVCFYLNRAVMTALKNVSTEKQLIIRQLIAMKCVIIFSCLLSCYKCHKTTV